MDLIEEILRPVAPLSYGLDFGAGNGWYTTQMQNRGLVDKILPLDVRHRAFSYVEPLLYDGKRIPCEDKSFDIVYAIDVLHHCPNPVEALSDLLRCTKGYILLKDHVFKSPLEALTIYILDLIGNLMEGVSVPAHYQKGWEWVDILESQGFERVSFMYPAPCHGGFLSTTNKLQFIGLWKKT